MDEEINGVKLANFKKFIQEAKEDKEKAKKLLQVEGRWNSEGGFPHFTAKLESASGTTIINTATKIFRRRRKSTNS